MKNTMRHKGYTARIEYSEADECFIGHIVGIRDIVGFHGESVSELREAFIDAVDDYLEACEKLGRMPQRPYSGKVLLRIDPALHAQAATLAEAQGQSLNAWTQELMRKAVTLA